MRLIEWGTLAPDALAPLYSREAASWRARLAWDTTASWATVESARATWGLPGLVCCDTADAIRGWTFFMKRDGVAELGGLVADSREATESLIDGVLAHSSGKLGGFIYATAPALLDAFAARGIAAERYSYLTRATNRVPIDRGTATLRPWRRHDSDETATLLREAYGSAGRLFARDNSLPEWRAYLENLISYSGCGVLHPELSRVAEANGGLAGLALITSLAPETAHLAQLAVSPHVRRAGLARTLVTGTLKSAHAADYRQMSLLVSNENTAACCLYRRLGFVEQGVFLALNS